jgi:hypothetical protein
MVTDAAGCARAGPTCDIEAASSAMTIAQAGRGFILEVRCIFMVRPARSKNPRRAKQCRAQGQFRAERPT